MNRRFVRRWISACLLGTALGTAGCDQGILSHLTNGDGEAPCGCTSCAHLEKAGQPALLAQNGRRPAPDPVNSEEMHRLAGTTSIPVILSSPASNAPASGPTVTMYQPSAQPIPTAAPSNYSPRPQLSFEPVASESVERVVLRTAASGPSADVSPTNPQAPGNEASLCDRDTAVRRGYVDLTVRPWFGHGEEYRWLCGQVMVSHATNTWRLHYASVDDADPYGGTVTLLNNDKVKELKDGQYVRVEGFLTNPDDHLVGAGFNVNRYTLV